MEDLGDGGDAAHAGRQPPAQQFLPDEEPGIDHASLQGTREQEKPSPEDILGILPAAAASLAATDTKLTQAAERIHRVAERHAAK